METAAGSAAAATIALRAFGPTAAMLASAAAAQYCPLYGVAGASRATKGTASDLASTCTRHEKCCCVMRMLS